MSVWIWQRGLGVVGLMMMMMMQGAASAGQKSVVENAESASTHFAESEADLPRRFYASVGIGFDYSRGDYGEPEKTDLGSYPVSLKLEYDPVTFKLSVPYVTIDGDDEFLVGENNAGSGSGSSIRHGIGDTIASLTYAWFPEQQYVPILDFTTKVKIPTASSAKDIGTGETDVTFQLEATEILGPVSVFTSAGYRLKGGSFHNIWLTSVGSSVRVRRWFSLGVAYDFREGSTASAKDSHELATFGSFRIGEHYRVGPYVVIGLSENAPDWGLGTTFTFNF